MSEGKRQVLQNFSGDASDFLILGGGSAGCVLAAPLFTAVRQPEPVGRPPSVQALSKEGTTGLLLHMGRHYLFQSSLLLELVGPTVGDELKEAAALAVAGAIVGILVYVWFRFEWQFGVGALVTLFHDVSVMLGFFAITQLQVDLNVVAAFLAIVGYSLNDTVVIYDRIRENLRKFRKMAFIPLLNLSLNETLSRTIVTSMSILLALGMLLIFGPEPIFALTLAILCTHAIGFHQGTIAAAFTALFLQIVSFGGCAAREHAGAGRIPSGSVQMRCTE